MAMKILRALVAAAFCIAAIFAAWPPLATSEDIAGGAVELETVAMPFEVGEKLVYDVFYKQVKLGEAVLTFHGEEALDGKDFYYITFLTNVPGFEDTEEIYAYKETFLPYRIVRHIKRAGYFPLDIREDYNQDKHEVRIKRTGTLLTLHDTIRKKRPLYNALLLTYYYRLKPLGDIPDRYAVSIPMADFEIMLKGKQCVKTKSGGCPVYVFKGEPSKFTFWLSADEKRIPMKIEGHSVFGYSFIFKSAGNVTAQTAQKRRSG